MAVVRVLLVCASHASHECTFPKQFPQLDMVRLNEEGMTILVATHDISLINQFARRTIRLKNGNIISDGPFSLKDY